ncbi:MAG: DNA primase [Aquificae bacterium]|nr:DNA primase [Aquificota bacterium]
MAISQETVEEVLRVSNVYDVVSEYLNLQRTGSNYKALCPFHNEKTPSFIVSPQKNIFKCFGCGKSGNALTFLMEYEGLSFGDAVIKLAERYNIPVKFTREDEKAQLKKGLYQVAEKVKEFYRQELKNSTEAKKYLWKREVSPSVVEKFGIGYSPTDASRLKAFADKEGITVEQLKQIGVAVEDGKGGFYDRFRGRIIFPIRDHKGRVVAFGGRVIDGNRQPKYLNSPETEIYSKGKVLYGFFESRDYLREKKEVVVVEGYLDLISLHQIGIKNVVATLGTALTGEQGKLLSRFVRKAILMFDPDRAGKLAVIRASKVLLPYRIEVYYCPLEKGKDPDDLAKEGYKKVEQVLSRAEDFLLFLVKRAKQEKDLKKRKEIIDLYLDLVSYLPDKHEQGIYVKELSQALGIPVEMLQVKERKGIKKEEEESLGLEKLSFNEKLVLKGLLEHREQVLSSFDKFDKISGSAYFLYLLNEILNNGDNEELEQIRKLEVPSSLEAVLEALNLLHRKWLSLQNELDAVFLSNPDDALLKRIFTNKKSLNTGGMKKK